MFSKATKQNSSKFNEFGFDSLENFRKNHNKENKQNRANYAQKLSPYLYERQMSDKFKENVHSQISIDKNSLIKVLKEIKNLKDDIDGSIERLLVIQNQILMIIHSSKGSNIFRKQGNFPNQLTSQNDKFSISQHPLFDLIGRQRAQTHSKTNKLHQQTKDIFTNAMKDQMKFYQAHSKKNLINEGQTAKFNKREERTKHINFTYYSNPACKEKNINLKLLNPIKYSSYSSNNAKDQSNRDIFKPYEISKQTFYTPVYQNNKFKQKILDKNLYLTQKRPMQNQSEVKSEARIAQKIDYKNNLFMNPNTFSFKR